VRLVIVNVFLMEKYALWNVPVLIATIFQKKDTKVSQKLLIEEKAVAVNVPKVDVLKIIANVFRKDRVAS